MLRHRGRRLFATGRIGFDDSITGLSCGQLLQIFITRRLRCASMGPAEPIRSIHWARSGYAIGCPTSLIKFLFETADRHAVQFYHGRCTRGAGVQEQQQNGEKFPFPAHRLAPRGRRPTDGHRRLRRITRRRRVRRDVVRSSMAKHRLTTSAKTVKRSCGCLASKAARSMAGFRRHGHRRFAQHEVEGNHQ